jgi:DNA-binding NarL/FixJ family response regulator
MSPYIAKKVISTFQKPSNKSQQSVLSIREIEVLELLSKGLLYKEIANKMGVSHETVKKHLKNIYQKLHVNNKIEALNKFKLL